jgi:hypothetical protein
MMRRFIIFSVYFGLLIEITMCRYAMAQVPSGVLRNKKGAPKKPDPETSESPQPLMYFDPDDPSKFPELIHRIPFKFRARHLPIIIGNTPSPSSAPESPINWR